jgi:hypothetical protein
MNTNKQHDEETKFQLELIDREIKAADMMMRLYCWVVMPLVLAAAGYALYSLF